tara:strand:- start:306 stop:524 length:219 start_codon:yes stop_codon:yes gene_type:complete
MVKKYLNFKFLSSLILLVITTVESFRMENTDVGNLWMILWFVCIIRIIEVLDDPFIINDITNKGKKSTNEQN